MKPIKILKISKKRFEALARQTRNADTHLFSEEIDWYTNDDETILGIIAIDKTDNDFVSILLGRDEANRFRSFDLEASIKTKEEAKIWLFGAMKWHTGLDKKIFPQGCPSKGLDLFSPIVPINKQHSYFVILNRENAYYPAKSIINEMMPYFEDIDGNFVEQFQSTGFDSRLWELYLNTYFAEENLHINRKYNAPDFLVGKFGIEVAVEAVIVGRKKSSPKILQKIPTTTLSTDEIQEQLENEMPIRFGSPLYSKLKKKYWELPHIKGKPIIFAIADFHDDQSMMWSSTALIKYLYGYNHISTFDKNNNLVVMPQKIDTHKNGKKEIPSGYFFQPKTENVSAVLFSASGTISKFNRIGRQAGFENAKTYMMRVGSFHDHNPNATKPKMFKYTVDENSNETWGEGLSMYHNPNAMCPVPEELFPSIAHHHCLEDGQILSTIPKFHPYASQTLNIVAKN